MRTVFKLIGVVAMMATTHLAWASYTFTMKLDISGSCGGWSSVERSTAQALFDRYVNSVNLGIPSRAECEQARQIIMSEINGIGSGSCKIRVVCGPCTGSGGMGDAPGVNLEGPSKGGSFYSGNASSEIRDWDKQNNALKQMLSGNSTNALPQNTWTASVYKDADSWIADGKGSQEKEFASNARNSKASGFVIDPDKPFGGIPQDMELVPLPAQKEKVSRWVSQVTDNEMDLLLSYPDKCEQTFQSLFREKTGIDINAIIQKPYFELTDDERQALGNYNEFLRQTVGELRTETEKLKREVLSDEGKRELDAVIIAGDCYKDSKHDLIEKTDYMKISSDYFEGGKLKEFAELIEHQNSLLSLSGITGLNASLYRNEVTGEYVVAFGGTEMTSIMDWNTNVYNGLGFLTPQYEVAQKIGKAIAELSSEVKINITGHSLGGGLASVAGLVSGAPTITVNAAGVPDRLLSQLGLNRENSSNIKALVSDGDILNIGQKKVEEKLGVKLWAIGDKKIIKDAGSHGVGDFSNKMLEINANSQRKWEKWHRNERGVSLIDSMMRTQLLKGENYERGN